MSFFLSQPLLALPTFTTGFATSAVLIMAIGAQNLFVLRQGLKREHVGPVVLFCAASDAVLIAAGVGGVGAFVQAVPQLVQAMTLGGAAFLACYGLIALRRGFRQPAHAATPVMAETSRRTSLRSALLTTAGFTFLNPHVYLDTVLLMGANGAAQPADLRPFFVAGAACASVIWFFSLGYGARALAPLFARPSAWRVLDLLVGTVMMMLALWLLLPLQSAGPIFG